MLCYLGIRRIWILNTTHPVKNRNWVNISVFMPSVHYQRWAAIYCKEGNINRILTFIASLLASAGCGTCYVRSTHWEKRVNPTGDEMAIGYINYFRLAYYAFFFFREYYWLDRSNTGECRCFKIFFKLILDFFSMLTSHWVVPTLFFKVLSSIVFINIASKKN